MHSLVRSDTMRSAACAAILTVLACYPRLWQWSGRPNPLWFLATLLLLTSFVLWSFVFGWYPLLGGRRVIRFDLSTRDWLLTGLMGLVGASLLALIVDPPLRVLSPAEYPATLSAWAANTLFSLTFGQLFLCYAPIAFFLRLIRHPSVAILFTVLFGEFLLGLQLNAASFELDLPFALVLLGMRALVGWVSAFLFLRGGLLLGTVWSFLLESRLMVV